MTQQSDDRPASHRLAALHREIQDCIVAMMKSSTDSEVERFRELLAELTLETNRLSERVRTDLANRTSERQD